MGKNLILIVENNEELSSSLGGHLLQAGFRTDCAADGVVGLSRFRLLKPALVFLKDELPRMTGFELLVDIRFDSNTPVIMTSAWSSWRIEYQCLKEGADDFIRTPYSNHVVTERIKKALRRGAANQLIRVGKLTINLDARTACVDDPNGEIKLNPTPSEYKLLVCMATSPGRVFTRLELIEHCFPQSELLESTINTHISNLRRKLEAAGIGDYLDSRHGVGYALTDRHG
ncbi:DNA-binding response regulator [Sinorhizobium meliloti]|uniref:response regulator transcription factor n=1 Tax=Rhizobium meliloti TaxID=382 RepID=UPI000FD1DC95|nr:response regulator transcription factor [Sinorhizobium meliloti]RVE80499.1 DNA-binding response regulator [Sinorhizobium meliloti]RVE98888.1 DNA-binding response regulator [Sinorhizobium meliloti]RVM92903.1 DNA-binding response regulator [Sinorhizobium meliloti]